MLSNNGNIIQAVEFAAVDLPKNSLSVFAKLSIPVFTIKLFFPEESSKAKQLAVVLCEDIILFTAPISAIITVSPASNR